MVKKNIRKVAVALRLAFASHRDIFFGISSYAKEHHWSIKFIPIPELFCTATFRKIEQEGFAGIITSDIGDVEMARLFANTPLPLVFIGSREEPLRSRTSSVGFVYLDDVEIGKFGANYLCSLGKFRTFGFLPSNVSNHCSRLRQEGFMHAVQKRLQDTSVFYSLRPPTTDGSSSDIAAIMNWLGAIPKPAAVMAVHDFRATNLLLAAQQMGLRVPSQLAVLGVDNDELLCDFTEPPLTSIAPDYVTIGRQAATALANLLKKPNVIFVKSTNWKIIERESTAYIAPSVQLVNRAVAYIEKFALTGISAKDVVAYLKTSRRLADMRFKSITGVSILEKIINVRLEALKTKLRHSNAQIRQISFACGFPSENYAKNLFKRRFKMTMREYRAQFSNKRKHGSKTEN